MIQPLTFPGISPAPVDNFPNESNRRSNTMNRTMSSRSTFACALCGCSNTRPCWDDNTQDRCHMITPHLCSACRNQHHQQEATCQTPTTTNTKPNEPTGTASSKPTTGPSADDAPNPSSRVNPSTSAIAKTSPSAATSGHAAPNTPTATAAQDKPSQSTPHPHATGDYQLDAELTPWRTR